MKLNGHSLPLSTAVDSNNQDISQVAFPTTRENSKHDENANAGVGVSRQKPTGDSIDDPSDTPVLHGNERLTKGASADPFLFKGLESIADTAAGQTVTAVTTDNGHVITATSAAIVNKGTSPGLGKDAVSANGMPLSLSTSETSVEVSRTQMFESESLHPGAAMTGFSSNDGTSTRAVTTLHGEKATTGASEQNITTTGVQAFQGKAEFTIRQMRVRIAAAIFAGVVCFVHV